MSGRFVRAVVCTSCGAIPPRESLIFRFGAFYHPYAEDPILQCGPVEVEAFT